MKLYLISHFFCFLPFCVSRRHIYISLNFLFLSFQLFLYVLFRVVSFVFGMEQVRERSDDSISSGQSASSTRTSSWFNKTKAIASLWRKRDEEALNAAVAPPLVKRPIVRVRTLGDRQAPQRMPSAEPRHTAGFESIVNDDDEENDLGRRLQAFLGDRDGDGRNIPRRAITFMEYVV
jgi:hypothetical protein